MNFDDWISGLGGALKGGVEGYRWGKEFEQKDREISNRKEVQVLQQEIRMMLESMKVDSREKIAGQNNETRSGIATQNNDARKDIAAGNNQTTMRGQDITQQLGILREGTQRRGQDFQFDLGVMRDGTQRRGQDFTFDLGVMRNNTTERGQDITKSLGMSLESGRNTRATEANKLRQQEIEQRSHIERLRPLGPWGGLEPGTSPLPEVKEGIGTGKPTAAPIEVRETTGTLPVAPRSPEAAADQTQRLEQQALSVIERFKVEKDPAKKAALRNDLLRLRGEIAKAQTKTGGR